MRIRIEFHVSGLSHTLSGIHLLDPSSEVVPDLIEADLLQSVGILTPVGGHGEQYSEVVQRSNPCPRYS